jgi:glycosyltransferase involved in cell wall biosynthesis
MKVFILLCLTTLCYGARIPEKAVICGICQDIAETLPSMITYIEEIGALFADYRILVYENNSHDATPLILQKWAENNPKVSVQCDYLTPDEMRAYIINHTVKGRFKPEQIARARNIVLDKAMDPLYNDFPFLVWVDMDFYIPPHYEGIVEVFEAKQAWDAVLAYGITREGDYWDWYAHRDVNYPLGPELLGPTWLHTRKGFRLGPQDDWYPVYSAFGGCGIYKKSSILGCRYSGLVTPELGSVVTKLLEAGKKSRNSQFTAYFNKLEFLHNLVTIEAPVPGLPDLFQYQAPVKLPHSPHVVWRPDSYAHQYPGTCEHVTFHAAMIARGHDKIFINPRLIFIYGNRN